jgi:hypothetical protein
MHKHQPVSCHDPLFTMLKSSPAWGFGEIGQAVVISPK